MGAVRLQGIVATVATPFDWRGEIYKAKVQHNFEKWNQVALAGYAVATWAGEGPLLEAEEKATLWGMTAEWAAQDRLLVADVTAEGVKETLGLARRAADAGFHYALCAMPRAYPEAGGLYARAVADGAALPVILRDPPETVAHPNVAAVLVSRVAREGELTGRAECLWESLQAGASGGVLASASADPYPAVAVWEAFRRREEEAGLDWQARVRDFAAVPELKKAMDENGYYGGPPRLPLSAIYR